MNRQHHIVVIVRKRADESTKQNTPEDTGANTESR